MCVGRYLSGVAAMMRTPRDPGSARHHLERARDMIRDLQQQHVLQRGQQGEDDDDGEEREEDGPQEHGEEEGGQGEGLPFAEELRLVADHLQLLDAEDRVIPADPLHSIAKGSNRKVADSMEAKVEDEEWSSDEDAGEVHQKCSGQDAMDLDCS